MRYILRARRPVTPDPIGGRAATVRAPVVPARHLAPTRAPHPRPAVVAAVPVPAVTGRAEIEALVAERGGARRQTERVQARPAESWATGRTSCDTPCIDTQRGVIDRGLGDLTSGPSLFRAADLAEASGPGQLTARPVQKSALLGERRHPGDNCHRDVPRAATSRAATHPSIHVAGRRPDAERYRRKNMALPPASHPPNRAPTDVHAPSRRPHRPGERLGGVFNFPIRRRAEAGAPKTYTCRRASRAPHSW